MGTIGVDFGGTWIRAAYVDSNSKAGDVYRTETNSSRNPESIMADLENLIRKARGSGTEPPHAIGIAIPTTLDGNNDLEPCPNLPTMGGYSFTAEIAGRLEEPVWIENDARCFVLGEWRFGKGMSCNNVVGITLGTSVGLGIVSQGFLLKGAHSQAGEIWRSPHRIDEIDRLENQPTVHDLLRGDALEELYQRIYGENTQGGIVELASSARQGDIPSMNVFRIYGKTLGNMLAWVCNILDPEIIVVGGSGSMDFELFAPVMRESFGRPDINVEVSQLGEKAAILGAAYGASIYGGTT